MRGLRIQCIQNPAVGREKAWGEGSLEKAERKRKVLIIGGGSAGLEVARVSSLRGHKVSLYEKEPAVGGQVNLEAMLPGRGEVRNIVLWLERQAEKAGARIVTSTEVTCSNMSEIVGNESSDVIVIATGARPSRTGLQGYSFQEIPGWQHANVYTYEDVLTGRKTIDNRTYPVDIGKDVLVFDAVGDVMACGIAELLAARGVNVEVATWWRMVGWDLDIDWTLDLMYEKLSKLGVKMTPHTFLKEIRRDEIVLQNVHSGKTFTQRPDSVVLVTSRLSENGLAPLARETVPEVRLVGDAMAPRGIYSSIFEGHRLGRDL